MTPRFRSRPWLEAALALGTMAGCGDSGSAGSASPPDAGSPPVAEGGSGPGPVTGPAPSATVSGVVAGLRGSGLVLQWVGKGDATVAANGGAEVAFAFGTSGRPGDGYEVVVTMQPREPTQTCTVENGKGVLTGAGADVRVACVTNAYAIRGKVSGLKGNGLVLENGPETLAVTPGGEPVSFSFKRSVESQQTFAVGVTTQPTRPAQSCTVSGGSGTVGGGDVETVVVNCDTRKFTVGGTVTGLTGSTLKLKNVGADEIAVTANGTFAFSVPVPSQSPYAVTVSQQPTQPSQRCIVGGGTGIVEEGNVTSVSVTCKAQAGAPTFTPAAGRYPGPQTIAIASATAGASLFFTTDGTRPTESSPVYRAPVQIFRNTTIRAIATFSGMADSEVSSATFEFPWERLPEEPTARQWHGVAVGPDGRIYAFGGHNGALLSSVDVYDPRSEVWSTVAPMPQASYRVKGAFADGKLYVFGGSSAMNHRYDPSTNTWSAVAPMPSPQLDHAIVTGADGRIYALGGGGGGSVRYNVAQVYSPSTNTWQALPNLGRARSWLGAAAAADGRIYAIGGEGSTGNPGGVTAEVYSPQTGQWTDIASMAKNRHGPGVVTTPDGRIWAIGGDTEGSVEVYTPSTNTWAVAAPLQVPRLVTGAALGSDGRIYAVAGMRPGNSPLGALEVFRP